MSAIRRSFDCALRAPLRMTSDGASERLTSHPSHPSQQAPTPANLFAGDPGAGRGPRSQRREGWGPRASYVPPFAKARRMGHPSFGGRQKANVGIFRLSGEEVLDLLDQHIASDVGDCFGERQLLWASLHAVLREAALLDSTLAGQRAQAFSLEHRARGVHVEELDLGDGGRADEMGGVVELRADLHAAAAGDAVGERIALLLDLGELT